MSRHTQTPEAAKILPPSYDYKRRFSDVLPVAKTGESPLATIPLSFEQQQIWLQALTAPHVPFFNEILVLEYSGAFDLEALNESFRELLRRHETLRTTFNMTNGAAAQVVTEYIAGDVSVTDFSACAEERREAEILWIATQEVQRPFDLAEGPLIRARLLRLRPDEHILIVTLHELIADEASLNIIGRELVALYQASSARSPYPLADVPIQYSDYTCWQKSSLEDDVIEQRIEQLRQQLSGMPPAIDLPTDRQRSAVQRFGGARQRVVFSDDLTDSLRGLSEQEGVKISATLLAAFQALLWRYTSQADIGIGLRNSGRDAAGTEEAVGLFAHNVIVRSNLQSDDRFRDFLRRVRAVSEEACTLQRVPFDRLVNELQQERDPSRNPLFQLLLSISCPISLHAPGWQILELEAETGAAKMDLELQLRDRSNVIDGYWSFDDDLFEAATIARMVEHFRVILYAIVADPDQHLADLPLLTSVERHQLLVEWNDTHAKYPREKCVHQLFESRVNLNPNATAVVFEEEQLTYHELNERANQLARYLAKLGVGPEVLVGLCVDRSVAMVVALLGILKAGGAYVPLDPSYPGERISFMLGDAEVQVLITQSGIVERLPRRSTRVVLIDTDWPEIDNENSENEASAAKPDGLAYVIYTSGSTGKPKGVQIPHGAVVNFLSSMAGTPGMTSNDRVLAVTTLSFDIAGLEIFLPLSVGASVEIVSRTVSADGALLLSKLVNSCTTVLQATPASWRMLLEAGWEGSYSLKALCGGEPLSRKLADDLLARTSSLWNMYGPTETTIWSTCSRVEPGEGELSIGRPIANTQVFILDKLLHPLPVGIPGELYIGGDGLARGYLKQPELTAEKFVVVSFSAQSEQRLYKTGDLARYLPNGEIQCLGRIDYQVKIRGFRIELGEIEAALRKHADVKETAVAALEDPAGGQRLLAYFVPAREPAPTGAELRAFLKEKLPEHMIPSGFIALKAMPLTPNGKIDRKALPQPQLSQLSRIEEFVAAGDILEAQLVKIWETVLGIEPIGIRHNFFELGGNSLLAVRLMQRIKQAFGKDLQIATLFEAPTVGQLAAAVRRDGWSPPWTSLVPIQTDGSKPPFFCVHGAGGTVLRFYDLARHLGSDQPVYGLQARGLQGIQSCDTRVEDMAARYLEEIRKVQPAGPYFIGGYSFGGLIAFEMAQQLLAEHQEQAIVVMFDTFCPRQAKTHLFGLLKLSMKTLSAVILKLVKAPASQRAAYISQIVNTLKQGIQRRVHEAKVPLVLKRVRSACTHAGKEYTPQTFPGSVILFRSQKTPLLQLGDPQVAWNRYVSEGVEVHEIDSNHDDVLREPQVRMIAAQLKASLGRAHRPNHVHELANA